MVRIQLALTKANPPPPLRGFDPHQQVVSHVSLIDPRGPTGNRFSPCVPSLALPKQKFPDEGLANVVRNVFDFDSYNKDVREVLIEVLHKHGIPIGAKPTSVHLAKE